ncbi:glycoside hydrolase family 1 protein [Kosmotoga pacifica]|uniref:Beta-glucosidase n=1 Tax=Kosmotoga pacifica TaxID=1330330 RepID=A0A0G2ZBZ0_9BACT|nr:family 1 glycosylhydrolase [Kosmotoga pacifica]AKI97069.1 beta-glucosidase [Kosmotoga pacifica]
MLVFPSGFLWGVATAGHQIEGKNFFSDWYAWEKLGKIKNNDTSEIACGSWDNFERDIKALKELGVKTYRYSIEWARVEPRINKFDKDSLLRYRRFTERLVEEGIKPVVTLHHFVNPLWFSELGGWENGENLRYFKRYVEHVVSELGDLVPIWITINEPNVYSIMSYLRGEWPPEIKDTGRAMQVLSNLLYAHSEAFDVIKERYPASMVSVTCNFMFFYPARKFNLFDRIISSRLNHFYNWVYLDSIISGRILKPLGRGESSPKIKGKLDFIGVNYYTRIFVRNARPEPEFPEPSGEKTDMGYEFYPEGLGEVVSECYRRYKLPVFVTENGIADATDQKRWRYIETALGSLHQAIEKGARVMGYLYWSLMDNFEWKEGYSMKFGLYETDFQNLVFTPRKSAEKYAELIEKNALGD